LSDSKKPQSELPGVVLVGVDLGFPHFDAGLEELASPTAHREAETAKAHRG